MDRSWSRLEQHGRAGDTDDDRVDPGEREARGHTEPAIRFAEVVRDAHDASVDREAALAGVHDSASQMGVPEQTTLLPLRVALGERSTSKPA